MKILFLILAFVSGVVFLSSCYYDKEELLYGSGNGPCTDTTGNISYTQKIIPMFQQYCYSCHSGNFPSGNIVMGTYTANKAIAQNGKLLGSVNHSAGYSAMPKGMAKLSNCQTAVIKKWINEGMQNN